MRMLALALMMAPLAGCGHVGASDEPGIAGTGSGGTRTYAATGFSQIELAGSDDVDVTPGAGFSVRAVGDAADLDRLRIRVDGDTLHVDRRRGTGMSWSGHKVTVHVTMPRLSGVDVAGSGTLSAARAEGERFSGRVAGSGDLRLPALAVRRATFDIAGSGTVHAGGTAGTLGVNMAGSGGFDAPSLHAREAEVSMAGSGSVRASVAGPAKVSMMGSGNVDLGPQARCDTSKMGSGSVRCGG